MSIKSGGFEEVRKRDVRH